jgi:flagellar hook protein FlgE
MSLYGIMRTSTSGMSAQADRLATVADNIANVNTTGYKRASTEFSSLLIDSCTIQYTSGSVVTHVRHSIGEQGSLQSTTSVSDLAVRGNGFFIVSDAGGTNYLTRAGSFIPNEAGELMNAAGFYLMGYRLESGDPNVVVNGYTGLEVVKLSELALAASPSTEGDFIANLPSNAAITAAGNLPSANAATAEFAGMSSLVTFDNLGNEVVLDIFFAKSAAGQWEMAVFNKADAPAAGTFPYASGPLAATTLDFDATTGHLTAASANSLAVPIPNGGILDLDLSQLSQLATGYTVLSAAVNGNPPGGVELLEISKDGTVFATYENGSRVAVYKIPLADVQSPDNLTALAGNVFLPNQDSGDVRVGFADSSNLGQIASSTLEQSTVDLATELTNMIDSQRSYTANSKVFQTGSELLDVLINLKR